MRPKGVGVALPLPPAPQRLEDDLGCVGFGTEVAGAEVGTTAVTGTEVAGAEVGGTEVAGIEVAGTLVGTTGAAVRGGRGETCKEGLAVTISVGNHTCEPKTIIPNPQIKSVILSV